MPDLLPLFLDQIVTGDCAMECIVPRGGDAYRRCYSAINRRST